MSCGLCGGVGCGSVRGTAGSSDCCPTDILESNQTCNATVEAPCIIPRECDIDAADRSAEGWFGGSTCYLFFCGVFFSLYVWCCLFVCCVFFFFVLLGEVEVTRGGMGHVAVPVLSC